MNPTRTEALQNLLPHITHTDLAQLYTPDMEVQVIVAQDHGNPIQQEYMGKNYIAFTDGLTIWKPFRIPRNAATEPEYTDVPMSFDLAQRYEGIGLTGWNWKQRRSIYVAFDFDSIVNHKTGLSQVELDNILKIAQEVPWLTIRRSTSGTGYHFYVFLDGVPTQNHTEHAALARAILAKLSSVTGYDFRGKVDTCGGNMWIAHRKLKYEGPATKGLSLVKAGTILLDIPVNWRDHMEVVTRKRHKINVDDTTQDLTELDRILDQRLYIPLDPEHLRVIKELEGTTTWWDNDHHILVTHTWSLAQLQERLQLRGIFRTVSTGKEQGQDKNCFLVPIRDGAWICRRFTKRCQEDPVWFIDGAGWTTCYFNRNPDLEMMARAFGGVERDKGGYVFSEASVAIEALQLVGAYISVPPRLLNRDTLILERKDGRLTLKIRHEPADGREGMEDWIVEKDKYWTRIIDAPTKATHEIEVADYENFVRHLVEEDGTDSGWVINSESRWNSEPLIHVRLALGSMGHSVSEINNITGQNIMRAWTLIVRPFAPEYPGNRRWNRNAPQFSCVPTTERDNLYFPAWRRVLEHCGAQLTEATLANPWCVSNGITNGVDYLKCWCASMFQEPLQPLPYLFFYGPQNCGKSIFHEALSLLFAPGYVRADNALTNPQGFNGELNGAILCVVEETNLKANKIAYSRIKDWVTSVRLPIHEKMHTPIHIINTTHWIQCANEEDACPIFPGDTRIVIVPVAPLENLIPKKQLTDQLIAEAPDFLASLLALELPVTNDRLNIPVITTRAKQALEESNRSELQLFLDSRVFYVPGSMITLNEFFEVFMESLDAAQVSKWTKNRVTKEMPQDRFPKGRRSDGQWVWGNVSFNKNTPPSEILYRPLGTEMLRTQPA